jgi:hypothetical protein
MDSVYAANPAAAAALHNASGSGIMARQPTTADDSRDPNDMREPDRPNRPRASKSRLIAPALMLIGLLVTIGFGIGWLRAPDPSPVQIDRIARLELAASLVQAHRAPPDDPHLAAMLDAQRRAVYAELHADQQRLAAGLGIGLILIGLGLTLHLLLTPAGRE